MIDLRRRTALPPDTLDTLRFTMREMPQADAQTLQRALAGPITRWARSPQHARRERLRARRLSTRAMSFEAQRVVERAERLPQRLARIARLRYLEGLTLRGIAKRENSTLHRVRTAVIKIEAWLETK